VPSGWGIAVMPTKETGLDVAQRCFDDATYRCIVSELHFQIFAATRSDALSCMGLLIGVTAFALVLGFSAGYAVRKRKSRMRRRYYHGD
jgi:hypothetical protein